MNRVVFLDRDGVINKCAPPHEYIKKADDFVLLPKVCEAVKKLQSSGHLVAVVTNQRGISRGMMTYEELELVHARMQSMLLDFGCRRLDGIYICPHEEGVCQCRKPATGLFLEAEKDLGAIDKSGSWMIGDQASDILAGSRYGINTILIAADDGVPASCGLCPNYIASDLYEAALYILKRESEVVTQ